MTVTVAAPPPFAPSRLLTPELNHSDMQGEREWAKRIERGDQDWDQASAMAEVNDEGLR